TTTSLCGVPLSWPVVIAPMGGLVLFHDEGDVEMGRGAERADTLQFLSGASGWSVEAVAAASKGPKMFQLYDHGDRAWVADQLASTQASIDALPAIADAVGDRAEVIIDGGFSRGTAVLKGLAWGARVVAVGRTVLWGLAVGGAEGVHNSLDILRDELRRDMAL